MQIILSRIFKHTTKDFHFTCLQYLSKAAGGTCRATIVSDLAAFTADTAVHCFVPVTLDKQNYMGMQNSDQVHTDRTESFCLPKDFPTNSSNEGC